MKSKLKLILSGLVLAGTAALMLPSAAQAIPDGELCSDCHTMHDSQGGSEMITGPFAGAPGEALTMGCVGCHAGTNAFIGDTVGDGTVIPKVLALSEPNYMTNTLAGGDFWWVYPVADGGGGNDFAGHNVVNVNAQDGTLGIVPPGNDSVAMAGQLTCAGELTGCHSTGGHHGNTLSGDVGMNSVADSFRFLGGAGSVYGSYVDGFEDPDWEWDVSNDGVGEHNIYKGVARGSDVAAAGTMSDFCAACHGAFHNAAAAGPNPGTAGGTFASPWLRHPVDFDMSDAVGDDYTNLTTYSVLAPTAEVSVDSTDDIFYNQTDDAIVMCLSCHRAHGSPFDDLMRWDYSTTATGGQGGSGCFVCHTTK